MHQDFQHCRQRDNYVQSCLQDGLPNGQDDHQIGQDGCQDDQHSDKNAHQNEVKSAFLSQI